MPRNRWPSVPPGQYSSAQYCRPLVFPDFVDLNDIWVLQFRDGLDLGLEPQPVDRAGVAAGNDHFQRDEPVEPALLGLVNDAHAAPAELPENLETRGRRTCSRRLADRVRAGVGVTYRPRSERQGGRFVGGRHGQSSRTASVT